MLRDTDPSSPKTPRHTRAGDASETDTTELIAYVRELQAQVLAWLQDKHPELAPRP